MMKFKLAAALLVVACVPVESIAGGDQQVVLVAPGGALAVVVDQNAVRAVFDSYCSGLEEGALQCDNFDRYHTRIGLRGGNVDFMFAHADLSAWAQGREDYIPGFSCDNSSGEIGCYSGQQ